MPAEPKPVRRLLITAIALGAALAVVAAIFSNSLGGGGKGGTPSTPASGTPGAQQAASGSAVESDSIGTADTPSAAPSNAEQAGARPEAAAAPESASSTEAGTPGDAQPASPTPAPAAPTYSARTFGPEEAPPALLGSRDPTSLYELEVALTTLGGAIESIHATRHFETERNKADSAARVKAGTAFNPDVDAGNYEIQQRERWPLADGTYQSAAPLGALSIEVNGKAVSLWGTADNRVWQEAAPGVLRAQIIDGDGNPVLDIERAYTLPEKSFDLLVKQTLTNRTGAPLNIVWHQYGPIELHEESTGYTLDARRVRFGFLRDAKRDPSGQYVAVDDKLRGRADVLKHLANPARAVLWPNLDRFPGSGALSWFAQTSRYFSVIVHARPDTTLAAPKKSLDLATTLRAITIPPAPAGYTPDPRFTKLLLVMSSAPMQVGAGQSLDASFGLYAGPSAPASLRQSNEAVARSLRLDGIVIYNLGGCCAFCTFQWLAQGLLGFLRLLHSYVLFDWALSIMVLVVCVRTLLHPITKRSQIGITRFSKQMQALAPKQKALQEKYRGDPARLRAELQRLMKEENVSYRGMLGCLPVFLQSPIWIALYAMLYFAFDLRHEPAFFGLFQAISGGNWGFMADLSAPDRAIDFHRSLVNIPLIGEFRSINILPLILGVVFFIQQKYLTPPSANMTPEQEQAQKISKVMMVVLFPVMMYNAPSGMTLYFITNSTLGIFESRHIRAHISKLDLEPKPRDPLAPARKPVTNTAQGPGARNTPPRNRFKDRG